MTVTLRELTALYLAAVALLALVAAAGVRCAAAVRTGVVVAEALLIAMALVDLGGYVGGSDAIEPGTHLAYLVASVALLPILVGRRIVAREPGEAEPERTDHLVTALACFAVIVVVWRLQATGA